MKIHCGSRVGKDPKATASRQVELLGKLPSFLRWIAVMTEEEKVCMRYLQAELTAIKARW